MTNMAFRQRVIEFVEIAKTESERHLSKYSAEEIASFRGMDLLDELLEKVKSSKTKKEKSRALENMIVAEGLHAAVMIQDIISILNQLGGPEHMESWNLSEAMYRIGFAHAALHNFTLRLHPDYRDMIFAIRAIELRYAEDREDYALAIKEAEEYWKSGGTDLHHVVAERLAKKYNLKKSGLKERFAPIARRYGRCFGEKGVKKTC